MDKIAKFVIEHPKAIRVALIVSGVLVAIAIVGKSMYDDVKEADEALNVEQVTILPEG